MSLDLFPAPLPAIAHSLRSVCSAECLRPRAVRRPSSLLKGCDQHV